MIINNIVIDNYYQCIYIHIPKTAGCSLYKYFGIQTSANKQHIPLYYYRNFFLQNYNYNLYRKYFKFTFVRNPWDRFVSCYFFLKSGGKRTANNIEDSSIINKFQSFSDFVLNFSSVKNKFKGTHFLPQVSWIDDTIDFIGRYESLEHDINLISNRLNKKKCILPHINASTHDHYTTYFTTKTKDIIAAEYFDDIKKFMYTYTP